MSTRIITFFEKFRRITSGSSAYMPEVDGLRFIAISWVVVLMHLPVIINNNLYNNDLVRSGFFLKFFREGGHGVTFFFMISGFILALPFIKEKIYEGKKISLGKYYLRRLTRLEPPYIVALLLAFVLLVFVTGKFTALELSDNLLASVFYVHNVVYGQHSAVLPVAWSLEIETRFYLLAPFLSWIFLVPAILFRSIVFIVLATAGCMLQYTDIWNPASPFINFICYFLVGMCLADLYSAKWKLVNNTVLCKWAGIFVFVGVHFIFSVDAMVLYVLKMYAMGLFFYIAITNPWWKKILSVQWISVIGGMCYSIYLIHLLVMSATTKFLAEFFLIHSRWGLLIYIPVILISVLFCCMIFYRFIEQPCMRPGWYKNIFKKHNDKCGYGTEY